MKVKIFEEIAEIEVVELRTAEQNRAIAETELKRLEEIRRKEEEEREQRKKELVIQAIPQILERINKSAEKGKMFTEEFLYRSSYDEKGYFGLSFRELYNIKSYLNDFLGSLGYSCSIHEYSDSWQRQSGKIGYVTFGWRNSD